ncbi:hypothetical protein B0T10DRAFT_464353 [Thelonectria olida]|uniref:Uncharacterized protein n=1 Tax=Thelonectria olida TaxID=1576542 RepID=A0A9P9AJV6_9HYPO|nr:hypothetical protein B0T10DRAFT_464353 [Thelonectria olida]
MDPQSHPPDLSPLPPPAYEESNRNAAQLSKTIQIIEYQVDIGTRHFSSSSTPGIKFIKNNTCVCTIPYAPRDYEQIVDALLKFDCENREWQEMKHSTKDQKLKLRFPYPSKTLWSVTPNTTGVFMAAARCWTNAKFVEAELHFNERSTVLNRGTPFGGGLYAINFRCPSDITGSAYVVFTLKNEFSHVVDQEICIIEEELSKRVGPIGVPIAGPGPSHTTLESNTSPTSKTNCQYHRQTKAEKNKVNKNKANKNKANKNKANKNKANKNKANKNKANKNKANKNKANKNKANKNKANKNAAQQNAVQQAVAQQAAAQHNAAQPNAALQGQDTHLQSMEFVFANQMQIEYSEIQLPQKPKATPYLPMVSPPVNVVTPCNTPYATTYFTYRMGNSDMSAQPIESLPVNVTTPRKPMYEYWYSNYSDYQPLKQ